MIKPYGGMLLVKEEKTEDKTTTSGIIISAAFADPGLKRGEVIDLGDGEYNYKGDLVPIHGLDIGDIIYYPQHAGTDIEDEEGNKYLLVNPKNVLAIKG